MKEFLISLGFWFYKSCGCSGGTNIYKNPTGMEVKVRTKRGEFELFRNGQKIDHGLITNPEKIKNYL